MSQQYPGQGHGRQAPQHQQTQQHGHQQQPQPPYVPPPAPARKARRWPWIVGILAAFIFGNITGNAGSTTTSTTSAASAPTMQPAAPANDAPAPAPAPVESAPGTITNGSYEIGDEVQPGEYRSPGPESGMMQLCYVDVQDSSGKFLLQEVTPEGQSRITLKDSWAGASLKVSGCQAFTKVGS